MNSVSLSGMRQAYLACQAHSGFEEVGTQQRHSMPSEAAPDGIAELWFDDAQALEQAMDSPEMAAAVEDAKRYLNMATTYALVVDENTVIG